MQQCTQQPIALWTTATPRPTDSLAALADASSRLRNLDQRLSLTQSCAAPLPLTSPLPVRLDDRLTAAGTRARKSVLGGRGVDRMASEAYPLATPPRIDFLPGDNSRLQGRDPTVVYA